MAIRRRLSRKNLALQTELFQNGRRGRCLPDASIMLELCELLRINVNELLTGERLQMKDYQKKAEENLVEMQAKKERAQKSLLRIELIWLAIAILLTPAHLAINYYFPDNGGTGIGLIILIIGLALFVFYFVKNYEIRIK